MSCLAPESESGVAGCRELVGRDPTAKALDQQTSKLGLVPAEQAMPSSSYVMSDKLNESKIDEH